MKPICCVAGRSGGHIIPCLTYAQQLAQGTQKKEIIFFTSGAELDKKLVDESKLVKLHIPLHLENVPRKRWWRLPIFAWQLLYTTCKSFYFLLSQRPSIIVSTGGYTAIPVCLVGRLLRIPVELFEFNVVPGKATRFIAPFASTLRVCFPETQPLLKKSILSGYPLKTEYLNANKDQKRARAKLGLSPEKKTVLILGGSQGSLALNRIWLKSIQSRKNFGSLWQVIHQAGNDTLETLKVQYAACNVEAQVFQFTHQLSEMYPASDVIVCRSGAGSLFEVAHFQKRCVTIPLETSYTTHQRNNAAAFARRYPHLFKTLDQSEIEKDPNILYEFVVSCGAD